jgi:hypothetical protein
MIRQQRNPPRIVVANDRDGTQHILALYGRYKQSPVFLFNERLYMQDKNDRFVEIRHVTKD